MNTNELTPEQQAEIVALADMPGEEIDTEGIPEIADWGGATRGVFYRPIK